MIPVFRPDAGEALAVFAHAFPSDRVRHTCLRHQIAFVARIEKHLRAQAITLRRGDFLDDRTFLEHSSELPQALAEEYANGFRPRDHVVQYFFGDLWLGIPPEGHPILSADSLIDLESVAADDD